MIWMRNTICCSRKTEAVAPDTSNYIQCVDTEHRWRDMNMMHKAADRVLFYFTEGSKISSVFSVCTTSVICQLLHIFFCNSSGFFFSKAWDDMIDRAVMLFPHLIDNFGVDMTFSSFPLGFTFHLLMSSSIPAVLIFLLCF